MIEQLLLALMTVITALFGGLGLVILIVMRDLWYELGSKAVKNGQKR